MGSPQRPPLAHVFRGTFVHSSRSAPMEILHEHLLGVDDGGTIVFLEQSDQQEQLAKKWGFKTSDIRELSNYEFFMPGMVDTHIHAPQYSFTGTRVDLPLLQWLTTYTFPTEAKYKDSDFAEEVYTRVVRRTLKNGTTTACYFATIYTDTSLLLAEILDKFGQRAFVGKVCMDVNDSVPQYKEITADSVRETERFVKELLEKKYPRVQPIITPRFGPSCTEDLLHALGNLAQAHDLHVQSHISENEEEIKVVENMFPAYQNYTELYDKNKLLTSKTVMAHACHLSEEELKLFSLRGAAISHCPSSNFSLCSGILNVQMVLKHNVKLGLGTDVAGGYSASMLDAIRKTMIASNSLEINKVNETGLTLKEAFQLATLGGSQALGLDDVIGNFEVGKEFDALLINTKASDSPFDLFSADNFEDTVQKFLYLGDDRNISEVYVAGRQVVPFSSSV
ncbi:guanine deaminase isoform X1 [Aquila chrysaetos chrysaetos]|uniref:guanine deaminase isoform X1 n=2 Tax=Aquila chrysaetos chrysaetos TaxID=223781 RepID=UPI001176ABDD|nr:guanine deaminase isoform X1 [Aquila chrysaetos chrysaetos]XP_040976669.1 guanine deaminase isoform X1 [Aquila chrysaetos chrysaetos]